MFRSFIGRGRLPEDVCSAEEITTYVKTTRDVDKTTNRVREAVFLPRRIRGRLETSVCRSATLNAAAVWAVCSTHVDPRLPKPMIGRGIGPAWSIIRDTGLHMHGDGHPHPYHANILGWHDEPGKPDNEIKHNWKHVAQRIAAHFPYTARPG